MSKDHWRLLIAALAFVSLSLGYLPAKAQETCESEGVEFGFFNGVATTKTQAGEALAEMRTQFPPTTPKGQPITYTLYYNDTEGLSDFVEVFEQRRDDAVVAEMPYPQAGRRPLIWRGEQITSSSGHVS